MRAVMKLLGTSPPGASPTYAVPPGHRAGRPSQRSLKRGSLFRWGGVVSGRSSVVLRDHVVFFSGSLIDVVALVGREAEVRLARILVAFVGVHQILKRRIVLGVVVA